MDYIYLLIQRRYCYLFGCIISLCMAFLSMLLGQKVGVVELIILPLSCSFIFGFMIYHFFINRDLFKEKGRLILFTKDGMFHLVMTFSTAIIGALLMRLFNIG